MTIEEYQDKVDLWIKKYGKRYFNELTNFALLTEEVGELGRIMARKYGEQSFKEEDKGSSMEDELADVLFVLTCIANQSGIDLTKSINQNFTKKPVEIVPDIKKIQNLNNNQLEDTFNLKIDLC